MLDLRLASQQLIECTIPALQLISSNAHARAPTCLALHVVAPGSRPAAAALVAHEVGLQPTRQPVLAAGADEAIGHQYRSPLFERDPIATAAATQFGQDVINAELVP